MPAFADGRCAPATRRAARRRRRAQGGLVAEDAIEFGDLDKKYQQSTFGAHFVEVGVDAATGEMRVRRMLAVCAAGRILNPKTARSQVIGAMTMGVGRGADGGARRRQAPRLLRQPRPRRLRGAGARRHPAPGRDLPRRDRSDLVADEGQGRRRARHLRRRRRRGQRGLQRHRRARARLSRSRWTSCWNGCRKSPRERVGFESSSYRVVLARNSGSKIWKSPSSAISGDRKSSPWRGRGHERPLSDGSAGVALC